MFGQSSGTIPVIGTGVERANLADVFDAEVELELSEAEGVTDDSVVAEVGLDPAPDILELEEEGFDSDRLDIDVSVEDEEGWVDEEICAEEDDDSTGTRLGSPQHQLRNDS